MSDTRVYRALLRLLPNDRRLRFGDEMAQTFAEQREAARRRGGALAVLPLWMKESTALIWIAARERLARVRRAFGIPLGWRPSSHVPSELRWAWRGLRARGPRLVLIASLLAIALAANTLLFSVADSLIFRTMPYRDADRVVALRVPNHGLAGNFTPEVLDAWRTRSDVFAGLHGYVEGEYTFIRTGSEPQSVKTAFITPGLIEMLGWTARWGRPLAQGDELATETPVAVIAEELARECFGDPSAAIGRRLETASDALVVIGVVPSAFKFPDTQHRIWRPLDVHRIQVSGRTGVSAVARLADGTTLETLSNWLRISTPGPEAPTPRPVIENLATKSVSEQRSLLFMLIGAALCLLIAACANVASLELAAAAARARQSAIRISLGATRMSIVRTAMLEGAGIFVSALLLAVGLATIAAHALVAHLPDTLTRYSANPIDVDWRALTYMFGVCVAAWLLTSIPVAVFGTRRDPMAVLKSDSRSASASRAGTRIRQILTVVEVALAVLLVSGGVLYVRSYVALAGIDKGFDTRGLAKVELTFPGDSTSVSSTLTAMTDRLRRRPDVTGLSRMVTSTSSLFDIATSPMGHLEVDDGPPQQSESRLVLRRVDLGFFDTLRMAPRLGRLLTVGDLKEDVVISDRLAAQLWPGADPLGRRFRTRPTDPWNVVVGVVGSTRNITEPISGPERLGEHLDVYSLVQPRAPRPASQPVATSASTPAPVVAPPAPRPNVPSPVLFQFLTLLVRIEPPSHAGEIFREIRAIDSRFTLQIDWVDDTYAAPFQDRLLATRIVAGFSVLAFLVAMGGIYGVMSCLVATRTREVGIRLALGADRAAIRRLVLASAVRLVIVGSVVGVSAAIVASRWMQAQFFKVTATDPLTYIAVCLTIVGTATIATWQPARRAARVDPAVTLRAE